MQQLARVVPLVHRLRDVDALVALQPDELAAGPGREHVRHLGLADPGLALEQQRPVQSQREEHGRGQALVGEIVVRGEASANVVDGVDRHRRQRRVARRGSRHCRTHRGRGRRHRRARLRVGAARSRQKVCGWRSAAASRAESTTPSPASATTRSASSPTSARRTARPASSTTRPPRSVMLDILVTNAGGPPPGGFASTDLDAYEPALALEPALGRRDVQGGRAVDAGARLGSCGGHHVDLRAPTDRDADPVEHGAHRARPGS